MTGVNRTQRNHYQDYEDERDYKDSSCNSTETALLNAIQNSSRRLQKSYNKMLQTHVPNFRGAKDKYNEFEQFLLNHFEPKANKLTEEDNTHFFQSLLRDEAIDYWQTITITPMTTLTDVLQMFRNQFTKKDMREFARFNQMSDSNTKQKFTRSDHNHSKSDNKRFGGKCLYCGQQGHMKQECRGRQKDEANCISEPIVIQPAKQKEDNKPKYNPKLVCQICGYTGHSARDCRKRIPKHTSTQYGQLPYKRTDDQENKERRRE